MKTKIEKKYLITEWEYELMTEDKEFKIVLYFQKVNGNIRISILNYKGDAFHFVNRLSEETLRKWENTAKLILEAIKVAKRELNGNKDNSNK